MPLSQRDWAYIEERLMSPSNRLGEAISRLRALNLIREADTLLRAQVAMQEECRAMRNELRAARNAGR